MQGLLNGLARVPGRKSVLFLTEGFFFEESWADLRQLVGQAARANVRIYTIDALGLRAEQRRHGTVGDEPARDGGQIPTAAYNTTEEGPNMLANDTGGYVIRKTNDFAAAMTEMARDTSNYYVLGFSPPEPAFDGKFRPITVQVKRNDVEVRARKGYLATAPAPADAPPPAPATTPAQPEVRRSERLHLSPLPARRYRLALRRVSRAASLPGNRHPRLPPPRCPVNLLARRPVWLRQRCGLTPPGACATLAEPTVPGRAPPWRPRRRAGNVTARAISRAPRRCWRRPSLTRARRPGCPTRSASRSSASGGTRRAAESWERVRAAVPEFQAVYLDLADAYLQMEDSGEAIEMLREAEKRWPTDVDVLNALGTVQVRRGTANDAIATFEKRSRSSPKDSLAYLNLGRTYELRYYQMRRFSRPAAGGWMSPQDLRRARRYYESYLKLGGPYEADARAALERLELEVTGAGYFSCSSAFLAAAASGAFGDSSRNFLRSALVPSMSPFCSRTSAR